MPCLSSDASPRPVIAVREVIMVWDEVLQAWITSTLLGQATKTEIKEATGEQAAYVMQEVTPPTEPPWTRLGLGKRTTEKRLLCTWRRLRPPCHPAR